MALAGPLVFGLGSWWALSLLAVAAFPLRIIVAIFLLKSAFAARALAAAAGAVRRPLEHDDLPAARAALRSLVSRDTADLPAPEIAGAAIESVAENASDSVVAPLFYYVVGGVPAALAYRAVNTLDAMIGYRGETEWLGKAAARLDDAANFIPARITALLLAAASGAGGGSPMRAFALWFRDGRKTESPNAGRPMAAMAGALGVELSKRGAYVLGAGMRAPVAADLRRAIRHLRRCRRPRIPCRRAGNCGTIGRMPGLIRRALFIAALCAPVAGCGDGHPKGFYGACDYIFTSGDDGTSSCWEGRARTVTALQGLRLDLCGDELGDLRPLGSRCTRDGARGGCMAAFGDPAYPAVMTAAIKWYYGSTAVETAADVMNLCATGDGEWLLPGQTFVPPDGDFPPLE